MYPPIHERPLASLSFDRLDMLWERYPQYRSMTPFSTLDALLEEHPSWQADFEEYQDEYESGNYEQFLIQLSWADLPYRKATEELIRQSALPDSNPYVEAFMHHEQSCQTNPSNHQDVSFTTQLLFKIQVRRASHSQNCLRRPDRSAHHFP